jgi:hypothetical protein
MVRRCKIFDRTLQIVGWIRTLHLSNRSGRVYEKIGFRQLFLVKPAPTAIILSNSKLLTYGWIICNQ